MERFLEELKRRKVFRVATGYGAVAFVVVQAASYVFPALLFPDVAFRVLVVLTLFGFPIALVLAWAFEVTPEGVRRTPPTSSADGTSSPSSRDDPDGRGESDERSVPSANTGRGGEGVGYGQLAAVFAAGMLVSLLVFGLTDPFSTYEPAETTGDLVRDRVLVLPFQNRTASDSLDPVGTMAADWITEGLSRTGVAQVVTTESAMAAARTARDSGGGAPLPRAVAARTGAGLVVSGAVYRQGDSLHLQAEVVDAASERVTHSLGPATARVEAPMAAVEEIRQRVLGALATRLDSLDVADALERDPPPYEAYRLYALGMTAFDDSDMDAAVDYFRQAHRRDSTFVLPLAKAVAANLNLGHQAAADSLVATIQRLTEPAELRPFTRAMVDYRRAQLSGTPDERYRTARELARLAPGSVWELVVGRQALCLGRIEEAARLLAPSDTLRDLPPTARGSYLSALSRALHLQGEHERELEILREIEHGTSVPAGPDAPPTIVYDSALEADVDELYDRVPPLAALGRVDRLRELAERRRSLPPEVEPQQGDVLLAAARELEAHGHREEAEAFYDRAIAWYRDRSSEAEPSASHLRGLAFALYSAGRWEEVRPIYRELVRRGEAADDATAAPTLARNRGRRGMVAAALGDTAAAREAARWLASDSLRALDAELAESGWPLYARAGIAAQIGEHDAAVSLLRRASQRECWSYFPDLWEADPAFEPLSDHPGFREMVS